MGTYNGPWQNHCRIEWVYSDVSVSQSTTSVSFSVQAFLRAEVGWEQYYTGSKSWSGHWESGSSSQYYGFDRSGPRVQIVSGGGPAVALADTAQSRSFSVTANHFFGSTSSTIALTVPARYALTPTGLWVDKVSDSQFRLWWTRESTYTGAVVQRRVDGGSWQEVARPSGNTNTWTDFSVTDNHHYEYRVAGLNSNAPNGVGQSPWSDTAEAFTTPAPPAGVSAARDGMDILVTAFGLPPYASDYLVQDNPGGAGWVTVAPSVTVWPWRHVSPDPGVTHQYRVYSVKHGWSSGWSPVSNTVQLQATPNAPSGLAPNGGVAASDEMVRLAWVHNPVDTTAQTAYELRYRPTGGAWTTVSGTTAGFRDVSLFASTTAYEWQVRTKGDHPDWSPWSAVATVTVVSRPGVAVVAPDVDWDQPVLTVEWTYLQGESRPQSGWQVELLDGDGQRLEFREGSGAQTTLTLAHRVEHDKTYTVNVWGATGTVWSAPASSTFDVAFIEPAVPVVSGVWGEESGAVELSVADGRDPDDAVTPVAVSFDVDRSLDGGVWEPVAYGLDGADVQSITDRESLSTGVMFYRVTAWAASGAASVETITVDCTSDSPWLSAGDGFTDAVRLPFNPTIEVRGGRTRTTHYYMGRSKPVAYSGEQTSRVFRISGVTDVNDAELSAAWHDLERVALSHAPIFMWRDPDGRRIYGVISDITQPRIFQQMWGFSFELEETDH